MQHTRQKCCARLLCSGKLPEIAAVTMDVLPMLSQHLVRICRLLLDFLIRPCLDHMRVCAGHQVD